MCVSLDIRSFAASKLFLEMRSLIHPNSCNNRVSCNRGCGAAWSLRRAALAEYLGANARRTWGQVDQVCDRSLCAEQTLPEQESDWTPIDGKRAANFVRNMISLFVSRNGKAGTSG